MPAQNSRDITDAQWLVLDPLIPEPDRRKDGSRPPLARAARSSQRRPLHPTQRCSVGRSARAVSPLPNLPSTFSAVGSLRCDARCVGCTSRILAQPRRIRSRRGLHRWQLRPGEKRGAGVGKTKRGKGTKIMAVAEGHGLPIAVCTESATPHEVTLVQQALAEIFVQEPVQRLIGDNAYDSDRLDRELS